MQPIPGIEVEAAEGFLERLEQYHDMIVNFVLEVRKQGAATGAYKDTASFVDLCLRHASVYPYKNAEEKEFMYEWGYFMKNVAERYGLPAGRVISQYLLNEAAMKGNYDRFITGYYE